MKHSFQGTLCAIRYPTCSGRIPPRSPEASGTSTAELARSTGVSRSGLVRFARACGYAGYRELQEKLQRHARATLIPETGTHRACPDAHGRAGFLEQALEVDRRIVEKSFREIDQASYSRAVRQVFQSSAVYVMGYLASDPLAHLLANYLSHVLPVAKRLGAGDASFYRDLRFIGKDEVLIAIAVPPYGNAMLEAMKFARMRGARVIALTDSVLSPPAQAAESVLTAPIATHSLVTSYMGLFGVIEAVVLGVIQQDPARAAKQAERLDQAVHARKLVTEASSRRHKEQESSRPRTGTRSLPSGRARD